MMAVANWCLYQLESTHGVHTTTQN